MNFKWDNFLGGGLLLYGMGLFLLWRGVMVIGLGLDQKNWVENTAVVTQSEKRTTRTGDRVNTSFHFEYEYIVDDEPYRNRRYSVAFLGKGESQGVKAYAGGDRIDIFYNPDNPKQAVVVRKRPSIFVYLGMALGGLFAWMATGLTFYGDIAAFASQRFEKMDAKFLEFGQQYQGREDEPFDKLVPEIIKNMPPKLLTILKRYLKNNNQRSGITYLHQKTGLSHSLCKAIFKEIKKGTSS